MTSVKEGPLKLYSRYSVQCMVSYLRNVGLSSIFQYFVSVFTVFLRFNQVNQILGEAANFIGSLRKTAQLARQEF